MKDLTKIYIDLSKCTEEERKHIFSLLPPEEEIGDYEITKTFRYLHYKPHYQSWNISLSTWDKTELTYPEFIKIFENGSLSLQTKLEMFYDFLYERGVAKQLGVGIDTIVKHFIDEKLLSNDR